MSQVKQVGLLAAGCQPWNKDVCAASGDRFAYCATLAIYIYQVQQCFTHNVLKLWFLFVDSPVLHHSFKHNFIQSVSEPPVSACSFNTMI